MFYFYLINVTFFKLLKDYSYKLKVFLDFIKIWMYTNHDN